jgi:hypothetical protein
MGGIYNERAGSRNGEEAGFRVQELPNVRDLFPEVVPEP